MIKNSICILTDDTVQFSKIDFPGQEFVFQSPIRYTIKNQLKKRSDPDQESHKENDFETDSLHYLDQNINIFSQQVNKLNKNFQDIIVILHSHFLSDAYETALQSIKLIKEMNRIHIFDSNSFSFGLGFIVQKVANLIFKTNSIESISRILRYTIPHCYGLIFSSNTQSISYPGLLTIEQAIALDILGQIPAFSVNDGFFHAYGKVNNSKSGINLLQEFLEEFDRIEDVVYFSGKSTRNIKDLRQNKNINLNNYSQYSINCQKINHATANMIGNDVMGLFLMEQIKYPLDA